MNLLENFINSLYERINKRSELVLYISDTLSIERESANRRLNGKVQFTIQEMGKLSKKLGISLDSLMQNKNDNILPILKAKTPMSNHSIEDMIVSMESEAQKLEKMCVEQIEYGAAFNSVPLEFYLPYSYLEKFMFYKWGYFHVGSDEYNDFSLWKTPERIKLANQKLLRVNDEIKNRIYIWDPVTIWSLAKEIKYFRRIDAINDQDISHIKEELHKMLNDIEDQAKMRNVPTGNKLEIYVSFINHGLNFYYFLAESDYHIAFDGYFISLNNHDKYNASIIDIQEWIISIKKVSTLISESGAIERHLFFEEQRNYIRDI